MNHYAAYATEIEWSSGLKLVKVLYLQRSCMSDVFLLINKSQLNNNVNSKMNFKQMQILLFMFHSDFLVIFTRDKTCEFTGLCRRLYCWFNFPEKKFLRTGFP